MNSVLAAVLNRAREGSEPRQRRDGLKIGLVIEGGGMRGVVSGGMVTALEYLGLRSAFDVVYGTSAGAINGAYFIAGQAAYGTTIYYENINNRQFIDFRRLVTPKPVWSLEFIFETVLRREKILNWEEVIKSTVPLKVFAACIDTMELVRFDDFDTRESLFSALKASSSFPILTGKPFLQNGRRLLDGGIIDPIPFRYPIAVDGCTHVLVMVTRPEGDVSKPDFLDRKLVHLLNLYKNGLAAVVLKRLLQYLDTLKVLAELNMNSESNIYTIRVARNLPRVGRSEIQRPVLVAGAMAGISAVYRDFFGIAASSTEVLRPHDLFGTPLSITNLTGNVTHY